MPGITELGHGRDILHVLSHIQSKFFIPGVRRMITDTKKSCPGCIKLNKKPFAAFEADVPNVLKSVQPPFCYCQADIFGPVLMDDKELLTWTNQVIDKINNRGAPLGITITPNHVILGFRDCYGDKINPEVSIQHQVSRWRIVLKLFHSLWEQEYTRRRLTVSWKDQGQLPQVGDIVLFKNEPIYRHPISAARVEALPRRRNGDVYAATISFQREVGGRKITVNRHLNQLFPFIDVEKQKPQETIHDSQKIM